MDVSFLKHCYRPLIKHLILGFSLLFPVIAWSHQVSNNTLGFQHGFFHPFSGLDHILAILSVGLLASQQVKPKKWLFPLCFLLGMLVGAILGFQSISIPFVQLVLLISVFLLALIISFPTILPSFAMIVSICLFALYHGHAHVEHLTANTFPMLYCTGFLTATILLQLGGYFMGLWLYAHWRWIGPVTGMSMIVSYFYL